MRTVIAIILGLGLGLIVSGFTYFNDQVIRQTMFVGNFLPISVFGLVILGLLVVNPLLRACGTKRGSVRGSTNFRGRGRGLTGGQVAIITAMGLAACAWPGSNFFRVFTGITAMPAHLIKNKPAWQSAEVMSYVPGGSARLGLGHVRDWPGLAGVLVMHEPGTASEAMWRRLPSHVHDPLRAAAESGRVDPTVQTQLLTALNDVIVRTGADALYNDPAIAALDLGDEGARLRTRREAWMALLDARPVEGDPKAIKLDVLRRAHGRSQITAIEERLNRLTLVALAPQYVAPPPTGEGLLLTGGRPDPFALDLLLTGWDVPNTQLGVSDQPWRQWWPTISLWGGLALSLGLAALCLAVIVHPQWSRRELLPYPIARFVDELAEQAPGGSTGLTTGGSSGLTTGSWLPHITRNRLFWLGLVAMILLHTINGLHAWFPASPQIKLQLPFNQLRVLFPNAARVSLAWGAFTPTIFFTAVAFAFFLATDVSLSVGLAMYAWLALGALLLSNGVIFDNEYEGAGKGPLMRFGAYAALAMMILYVGRRYYLNVAASAIGLKRDVNTPGYAPWAARLLVLLLVGAVALGVRAGLDAWMSAVFVALCMLTFVVISRICAETGLFFVQAWWMPMSILTALFGAEAIGPTTYIVLALSSVMLVGDPRETLMPYLVNGLQMGDRTGRISPGRLAWPLGMMVVVGFVVALLVTFYNQNNEGANTHDSWATNVLPAMPFTRLSALTADLTATGELTAATNVSGLDRFAQISPVRGSVWWVALGMGLVFATALARLRLPWWPIHPIMFLIWGTYPSSQFHLSFLLGWLIKSAVVKTMGAKGYHSLKPLMVGVIAGELLAGLGWMAVGVLWYAYTGEVPKQYRIFPA